MASLPNIKLMGPAYQDSLPRLVEDVSVWWLLLRHSVQYDLAAPLKLSQSLASGRPVIATPLTWALKDRRVRTVHDGVECARETCFLHERWGEVDVVEQRMETGHFTWEERAQTLLNLAQDETLLR